MFGGSCGGLLLRVCDSIVSSDGEKRGGERKRTIAVVSSWKTQLSSSCPDPQAVPRRLGCLPCRERLIVQSVSKQRMREQQ